MAERADQIAAQQEMGVPLDWITDWQPWVRDLHLYERSRKP